MVTANITNPLSNGSRTGPYADKDEADIREAIDAGKEQFIELDIEESRPKMVQLAQDLSELNDELASRKGGDPTAEQYEEAADKWADIASLVMDGTDPTESLQSGPGGDDPDMEADVEQFHMGVPETTFADVGGYSSVKDELEEKTLKVFQYSDLIQGELGQSVLNGLILTGPPGTGKTLMSKAIAGELNAQLDEEITVFKVKPNQLKRGLRGESGNLMRGLFSAAKHAEPAVIIFEEIDTLIQDRSDTSTQTMRSDRDLVNTFLEEVNEIEAHDVFIMGTTNRAEALDAAAVRDKRLRTMEMGLPDMLARMRIFRIHLRSVPSKYVDHNGIDISTLAQASDGFTGATIDALVGDALIEMAVEFKEGDREQPVLTQEDLVNKIKAKQSE